MNNESGFKLKDFNALFTPTDPAGKLKSDSLYKLSVDKLFPFKNHPFKLYTGQRLADMADSIKENGVLVPIIVRPIDDTTYEILSGHNRVEAAKIAGAETIPAIVRKDLDDAEALLIVTETNLLQRSFADMSHSERAVTLSIHHEAIKKQGKRTDLINEIESMVNAHNIGGHETSVAMQQKLSAREKTANEYGLNSNTVAQYLRINKLTQAHKDRLDDNELALRAAVTLSYLAEEEQQIVDDVLTSGNFKLDMKKAEALRQLFEKNQLTEETAEGIFTGKTDMKKPSRSASFKLKPKLIAKYFRPEQQPDEIEAVIIEALDFYYSRQKQ